MSNADRDPATEETNAASEGNRAGAALDLMMQALILIDANEGPDDAGAYLDQAIHRLQDWIDRDSPK